LIGGLFPIGAGQIRLAYSEYKIQPGGGLANPTAKKWALGYVHNLSKRSAVYVTWADVSNSNGAQASAAPGAAGNPAANKSSSGFDLGLRHSF
jgi:predicted porin